MSYFEKVPSEYLCTYRGIDEPIGCKPDDFCTDPDLLSYEPNWELKDSYHNWIERMNLTCASPGKIGFIASSVYLGWFITLMIVPRIADVYGRKNIVIIGSLLTWIVFPVLVAARNYHILIGCLFTMGLLSTIRIQVGIIYMLENMPKESVSMAMTLLFSLESATAIFAATYFTWISKETFWLEMFGYMM